MKRWEGYQHGVNLGGWLSQCDHTKERYEGFITEEDIRKIGSWGLDHVRVPVDYEATGEEGLAYIDRAVDWCGRNGLNMILDLHKTYGFSFDDGEGEKGLFESEELQERFYDIWERLAKRYGSVGDRLAFELLNEVTDREYSDKWNEVSKQCMERIRSIVPTVRILIGGYYNNSIEALPDLLPPYDENVIYNFHCYEPLIFTHQGAFWAPGMDPSFRISVDEPYGVMEECSARYLTQVTVGFGDFDKEDKLSPEYFGRLFSEAVRCAEERGTSLYCGEYGVINLATAEDTLKWYRCIGETFEKYGIGRAAWSYKEMDFGLADDHMRPVFSEIVRYL